MSDTSVQDLLPNGWYPVTVVEAWVRSLSSTRLVRQISVTLRVTEGAHEDCVIRLAVIPLTEWRARRQLRAFGLTEELVDGCLGETRFDMIRNAYDPTHRGIDKIAALLPERRAVAHVVVRQRDDGHYNEVTHLYSSDSEEVAP